MLQHFSKAQTNNLPNWKAQVRKGPGGEAKRNEECRKLLDDSQLEGCWRNIGARCQVAEFLNTPLSVLFHFVALADCIRSDYFGGQLLLFLTRNILLSFSP